MRLGVALRAGIWTSIISLGSSPARRAPHRLDLVATTLVVVALVGLGALVVLLKTLGH